MFPYKNVSLVEENKILWILIDTLENIENNRKEERIFNCIRCAIESTFTLTRFLFTIHQFHILSSEFYECVTNFQTHFEAKHPFTSIFSQPE